MSIFTLPDLGEGLREAEIVAWHVSEGDHIVAEQPLVSVETDKAIVEIPAPYSGTITKLFTAIGGIVPTGGRLAEIETKERIDPGAIVGDLDSQKPVATPAVRRLAREHGLDLTGITGTGPGGTISTDDVLAAVAGPQLGEELRGPRRTMARVMAQAHSAVVPATIMDQAVIAGWSESEEPILRLIRAIVAAAKAVPALNAWFDGTRRQLNDHVDLAIAMDTPDGLFAPVLRGADSDPEIAANLTELRTHVRDRTIAPEALKGATFTLSNFGMIGGEHAVLVVSPPQVAILGAGRISKKVILADGKPIPSLVLPLSLTFDHRVVTG